MRSLAKAANVSWSAHALAMVTSLMLATLMVACGGTAPAPTPTIRASAPIPPTAAPTQAPSAPTKQATQADAPAASKRGDFPVKGKPITLIVPLTAGGACDITYRLMLPLLDKELGTTVQVVNKPGAGTQTGLTELANAKPDGYVVGSANVPTTITIYLDPERKAAFKRSSFEPIANCVVDNEFIAVKADSPFKSLKDLVDAARANPEKIKIATTSGKMSPPHLGVLLLEKAAGVKFATVLFDGGAEAVATLLGGHVDACLGPGGNFPAHLKSGAVRMLGVMDKQENPLFPGVKTFVSQGYDANMSVYFGLSAPAGTDKEIINIWDKAIKRAVESKELKEKMSAAGMRVLYLDPAQFAALWQEQEKLVEPLMPLLLQRK